MSDIEWPGHSNNKFPDEIFPDENVSLYDKRWPFPGIKLK